MLLLLLLSVASATELVLSLSTEPIRYHGELLIDSGEPLALLGRNNLNARVKNLSVVADFTCRAAEIRRGVEMSCTVDAVTMAAQSYKDTEQPRVDLIVSEYAELLTFEQVGLRWSDSGLLRSVELDGVAKTDERAREIQETLRLLMRRMFVPFEQQPPRRAVAGQRWKHRGDVAALELFSKYGTVGGTVRRYVVDSADVPGVVDISSTERGTIGISSTGAEIVTGGGTVAGGAPQATGFHTGHASMARPEEGNSIGVSSSGSLYSVTGESAARFDASVGWWVFAESIIEGEQNQSTPPMTFTHAAWLGQIGPDGAVTRPAE